MVTEYDLKQRVRAINATLEIEAGLSLTHTQAEGYSITHLGSEVLEEANAWEATVFLNGFGACLNMFSYLQAT